MSTRSVEPKIEARAWLDEAPVRRLALLAATAAILFLALYNLAGYPHMWFDEGSHLHVPEALVRFGVYADYSSEGYRYFGPTIGIGPTVILPIALSFKIFGIGLMQARLVMVGYLLAAMGLFFFLARYLGGSRMAWVALLLLLSSRAVALLEYGRQVLGEVPALAFVLAALLLWYVAWEKSGWLRLVVVGLVFGLATVTKYQFLLFIAPTLLVAWLTGFFYYRSAPQRVFLIPGIVTACTFVVWQAYLVIYLGPATATENLAILRETAAGAAIPFSTELMVGSLGNVFGRVAFMGCLLPVLIYGIFLSLPRNRIGQQWSILFIFVLLNLGWYVVASIGWLRYVFPGMAIACLFVAQFFHDVTGGFSVNPRRVLETLRQQKPIPTRDVAALAMAGWLAIIIAAPLVKTTLQLVSFNNDASYAVAAYLDEHIPYDAIIETWEPEMGLLTDHNYHFPPATMLSKAVSFVHLSEPSPAQFYDYVQVEQPPYLLLGNFGKTTGLYAIEFVENQYRLLASFEPYELYILSETGR